MADDPYSPDPDPALSAIIEQVGSLGYEVNLSGDSTYRYRLEVIADDGDHWIVRGDDAYAITCELARQVGIDVEDG